MTLLEAILPTSSLHYPCDYTRQALADLSDGCSIPVQGDCEPSKKMARFSLRRSSRPDDHIVFCNGVEVGRCYLRAMNYGPSQWLWTIYIEEGVILGDGAPVAGVADTLDKAVAEFATASTA